MRPGRVSYCHIQQAGSCHIERTNCQIWVANKIQSLVTQAKLNEDIRKDSSVTLCERKGKLIELVHYLMNRSSFKKGDDLELSQ